jgi:GLPGLI family protein
MKNKTASIFFFLIFIGITNIFGQKTSGIVNYIQTNSTYQFKAKLYFTFNKSSYKFTIVEKSPFRKEEFNNHPELNFDVKPDELGEITFTNFSKKQILARETVGRKSFIYEEPLPTIKWKLLNESKEIGKFKCQKATTTFRGRNYIAWFTTDIPISMGPWKLQGLPGLILEAYDDTLQIQFAFESILMPEDIEEQLIFPIKEGRKISFEEHKTINETTNEKVVNAVLADAPKGTTIKIDIDKRVFF